MCLNKMKKSESWNAAYPIWKRDLLNILLDNNLLYIK
ncbi:hypothetical protein J2T20_003246 [Paenibacillus wynnii]|nr:hypothetical protein [Paenibacillus wynnii]